MSELNDFQQSVFGALSVRCRDAGLTLTDARVDGNRDRYVYVRIADTELECYINVDGAQVLGGEVDCRFEAPDYDSLTELGQAFVAAAATEGTRAAGPKA